ncbi:hypothetical protein RRG08_008007 [Elysia crispata]|uniref:Uncharacterized protein n=1 Tax=Elysia crispata TaxID=231223 RepID=A0AAE1D423_9GAST|nr:hypothetical protein RRG08_008007 [Elysia crispata]
MLKHVSTRWLSIGKCLERLLTNWEPLKSFFKQEVADKTLAPNASKKASKILETLRSRSVCLYIMFLSYTIKLFDSFLTVNQSDSPKAHKMQNSCRKLIRDIRVRFVVPAAFGGGKVIEDVDYKSKYNLKHDKDLIIGEMSRVFIENKEI